MSIRKPKVLSLKIGIKTYQERLKKLRDLQSFFIPLVGYHARGRKKAMSHYNFVTSECTLTMKIIETIKRRKVELE